MRLATYERITWIAAILIMLLSVALWAYYFHYLFELLFEYNIHFSFAEIFEGWYSQILELAMTIIGIVLLLIFRRKGLLVILGVCAIILSLECALDAYLLLVEYKKVLDPDPVLFVEGAISLVIAAMLFFNAILYSTGATKSATLIRYGALVILLLQVLSVITEIREGSSLHLIFTEREFDIPSYLMLFLVLHMSVSKYTRQASYMGMVKSSMMDLRNSMMVEGVSIDRDIAVRFSDYNKNGLWCDSYSFILTTFSYGEYSMSLVPVGDNMVGRISSNRNDSGMNVFRFNVTGVWFDTGDASTCDLMRFYGTDGMFIQLIVRDPHIFRPKGVPKIGSVILASREDGTKSHRIKLKIAAVIAFLAKHTAKVRQFIRTEIIGRFKRKKKE